MSLNVNVPNLRFSEFSGEWEEKKLREFTTFFSGGTPLSSNREYYKGTIPFIGSGKISDTIVKQFITTEALLSSSAKLISEGDLLYALYGATSGEVAISKMNGAINQAVLCIRSKENVIFLFFWLSKKKQKILSTYLQGGQGNLSAYIIKNLKINLPENQEQEKIASFLSAVDTKLEQLTAKTKLLQEYKKGVMQKIFSQEIRFHPKGISSQAQGRDDDGSDYSEWVEKKLGEISICLDNLRKPLNSLEREKIKGDIPYWGANNIMGYVNDFIYNEVIILLAEDGGNFNEFQTRPIANISYGKCWVNNHTHVLKAIPNVSQNEFLFYELVHKNITGYVSGGTRAKLIKSEMLKIKINLPSLNEQTKIANFLSSIDSKIGQTQKQLNTTKEFKKALLQQMFV